MTDQQPIQPASPTRPGGSAHERPEPVEQPIEQPIEQPVEQRIEQGIEQPIEQRAPGAAAEQIHGTPARRNTEPWFVHEHPERPLGFGACFCDCDICVEVLDGVVTTRPELPLGAKFGLAPRVVLDAGLLSAGRGAEEELLRRFGDDEHDWIRELWVAGERDDGMSPGEVRLLAILASSGARAPRWNVEIDADGATRPAPVRRLRLRDRRG